MTYTSHNKILLKYDAKLAEQNIADNAVRRSEKKMKNNKVLLEKIQLAIAKIKIFKKDTVEAKTQRETFRIRWGKYPEEI